MLAIDPDDGSRLKYIDQNTSIFAVEGRALVEATKDVVLIIKSQWWLLTHIQACLVSR